MEEKMEFGRIKVKNGATKVVTMEIKKWERKKA